MDAVDDFTFKHMDFDKGFAANFEVDWEHVEDTMEELFNKKH